MDPDKIQALLDFISKSGLDEVKIETDDFSLKVKKSTSPKIHQNIIQTPGAAMPHDSTGLVAATPPPAPPGATENASDKVELEKTTVDNHHVPIKSPMIGTFYQAANPDAEPFIKVGDKVNPGKTVCVVEAMKLFNEIESEVSGTVVEILVEDASPVQYDQPLFLVDPS